jgi:hypothetical protein
MLTRKELAHGLDISEPMVSRLVARGMPDSSVEAAERWRSQHLNIARVKRDRRVELRPAAELVAAAGQAIALAGQALDIGNVDAFDALEPAVRAALSAVPKHARALVCVRLDVMERLVAPVLELLRYAIANDPDPPETGRALTDAEADTMGLYWYALAAGERAELS